MAAIRSITGSRLELTVLSTMSTIFVDATLSLLRVDESVDTVDVPDISLRMRCAA